MSNPNTQVLFIPLSQIRPDPDQPRQVLDHEDIDLMAASLTAIGQKTSVKVRPLTPEERATSGEVLYQLIGGHSRYLGALKAGLATLKCEVFDLTPEEAELEAFMDNQYNEMSWIDKDLRIARIAKRQLGAPQKTIATQLKVSERKLFTALKIDKALTPASVSLIRENIQKSLISEPGPARSKNKPFLITENMVEALSALPDPLEVEKALKVVWDNHMPEAEVKALASWVRAGKAVESFDPKAAKAVSKTVKSAKTEGSQQPHHATHAKALADAPSYAASANEVEPVAATPVHPTHTPKPALTNGAQMGSAETALYEALAGVSVIAKIKAKIKKGERPNLFEVFLLALHNLWSGLFWLIKLILGETFKAIKSLRKLTIEALKGLGWYKAVRLVVVIVFLIGLIVGGWYVNKYGVGASIHWVYSTLYHPSKSTAVQSTAAAPTAVPTKVVVKAKVKHTPVQTPVSTTVVQITPTVKPQGDLFTQGADAAKTGAGIAKALGL